MLMVLYGIVALNDGWYFNTSIAYINDIILFIAMMALGMGNGSVFQLVPQRFRQEVGIMTGIVGAAGGSRRISSCRKFLVI